MYNISFSFAFALQYLAILELSCYYHSYISSQMLSETFRFCTFLKALFMFFIFCQTSFFLSLLNSFQFSNLRLSHEQKKIQQLPTLPVHDVTYAEMIHFSMFIECFHSQLMTFYAERVRPPFLLNLSTLTISNSFL